MYGNLKDYLRNLNTGKLAPLHPNSLRTRPATTTAVPAPTRPCLCPCHYTYPVSSGANASSHAAEQDSCWQPYKKQPPYVGRGNVHQHPVAKLSMEGVVTRGGGSGGEGYDPAVVAHAARLMRLLENDYQSESNAHGNADRGNANQCESDSISDTISGLDQPYFGGGSMCAYHSDLKDSLYCYRSYGSAQHAILDYYNHYYNHRVSVKPSAEKPEGGETSFAETNVPLFQAPGPSYANLPGEGGDSYDHSQYCHCYHDSDASSIGDDPDYRNLPTACAYCSAEQEVGEGIATPPAPPHVPAGSICPDLNLTKEKLSYFEVLDYAHQIARGMEHLDKMKVCFSHS